MSELPTATIAKADLPPLHANSVFGILGAALQTYLRFPFILLLMIAPLELPLAIVNGLVAAFNPIQGISPAEMYSRTNLINLFLFTFIRLVLLLGEVAVSFFVLAAITRWLGEKYAGRRISVTQAYKAVLPRFGALMGGMAVVIGAGIVSIFFLVILAVLLTLINLQVKEDNGFVPGAGGLPLPLWQLVVISVPPTLLIGYLLLRWSMLVQVVMLERVAANRALVRSWRLVGGRFWQVAATLLLAVAPAILLTTVVPLLLPILTTEHNGWVTLLFDLAAYLLRVLLLPFGFVAIALAYFDLRIRKEQYSTAVLAAELADKPAAPTYPPQYNMRGQ